MSKSTTSKQGEQLNIQNNVEEIPKEVSSIVNRNKIENSPFWAIGTDEGWFITMGDYRLTEPKPTEEEAIELLLTEDWNIIMRMCAVITEKTLAEINKKWMEESKAKLVPVVTADGPRWEQDNF